MEMATKELYTRHRVAKPDVFNLHYVDGWGRRSYLVAASLAACSKNDTTLSPDKLFVSSQSLQVASGAAVREP